MKTRRLIIPVLFVSLLLVSCGLLTNFGVKVIIPSNNMISENRDVSGYSAIEFSTFGKLNIIQGDTESLNLSGPDNLVPEITTTVNNGKLVIKTRDNISVTTLSSDRMLTFTIVVKDLTSLDISGAGDVQVETLSSPSMDLSMSGAGRVQMNQLTTNNLQVDLSGLGGLDISGNASQATIDISGAGSVNASDLKLQTASINISGLGSATVWVTDQLSGEISGAGSVSYYGSPQISTSSSGLGQFKPLGSK
jgi:tellurite resistance-related uncharacterized protein